MSNETNTQETQRGPAARWTQRLTAAHGRGLFGSSLGWGFDGYEVYALVLGPIMITLLPPARRSSVPFWLAWRAGRCRRDALALR